MANRIPVVISQHERRAGSVADYEEQLITRIVMESGLDATLIADLKSIELDTTDHLCIEGLKGDFALATWETTQYVCNHLHRLGIPLLEIIPVDGSEKSQSGDVAFQPPKKIFMISLATKNSIDETIKTLQDLLLSQSIPVFSLGAPIHRNKQGNTELAPEFDTKQVSLSFKDIVPASIRIDSPLTIESGLTPVDSDFPNIDQLMDDLDRFEI